MKKVFIALCVTMFLTACSKEDALQQEMNRLRGSWDLESISGGFAGTGYQADFIQLSMTNSNRYTLLAEDNSTIQEGSYTLSIEDDQLMIRFISDVPDNQSFDKMEKKVEWKDENRKLFLSEPCCDLYNYSFEKTTE